MKIWNFISTLLNFIVYIINLIQKFKFYPQCCNKKNNCFLHKADGLKQNTVNLYKQSRFMGNNGKMLKTMFSKNLIKNKRV